MDLHCEIITPEKIVYDATVGLVTVPGVSGKFTILKNHAPIIAALKEGSVRVIGKDGHEHFFECKSGVLENEDNKLVILLNKF